MRGLIACLAVLGLVACSATQQANCTKVRINENATIYGITCSSPHPTNDPGTDCTINDQSTGVVIPPGAEAVFVNRHSFTIRDATVATTWDHVQYQGSDGYIEANKDTPIC